MGEQRVKAKKTKAFTLYALVLNNLGHTGEGVKAKNKNRLTRAYTRARGSLLRRPRGLMPLRSRGWAEREVEWDILVMMDKSKQTIYLFVFSAQD